MIPFWIQYPRLQAPRVRIHQALTYKAGHPIPVVSSPEVAGALLAPMKYVEEAGLDLWGHPSVVQAELDAHGVRGSRGDCDTTAMWLAAVALKGPYADAVRLGAAFWEKDGRTHGHAVCAFRVPSDRAPSTWYWQSNWHQCMPVRGSWVHGMAGNFGSAKPHVVSWRATLWHLDTIVLDDPRDESGLLVQ